MKQANVHCQQTWVPEGAPTPDEQLQRWLAGEPVCPNTRHECCPDFSCCTGKIWPEEKRRAFVAGDDATREKMLVGALTDLLGSGVYVTRGVPQDRE